MSRKLPGACPLDPYQGSTLDLLVGLKEPLEPWMVLTRVCHFLLNSLTEYLIAFVKVWSRKMCIRPWQEERGIVGYVIIQLLSLFHPILIQTRIWTLPWQLQSCDCKLSSKLLPFPWGRDCASFWSDTRVTSNGIGFPVTLFMTEPDIFCKWNKFVKVQKSLSEIF